MSRWDDIHDELNSEKYRTGKKCIDCENPAGTAWSPLWCQPCNAKRMFRLDKQFKMIDETFKSGPTRAEKE